LLLHPAVAVAVGLAKKLVATVEAAAVQATTLMRLQERVVLELRDRAMVEVRRWVLDQQITRVVVVVVLAQQEPTHRVQAATMWAATEVVALPTTSPEHRSPTPVVVVVPAMS
jgi:hypothetical protein